MEKNVLEFLENSQRMYGEKTACADMNNELTYTQLMNCLLYTSDAADD